MGLELLAPAKINLGLEIIKKQSDEYHEVDMVMQSISLFDKVKIEIYPGNEIDVILNKNINCSKEKNTAYKAVQEFFNYTKLKNTGLGIFIEKNIPINAGLAGGSTDAAAVIKGLNNIFGTNLSLKELVTIGKKVGSDVPFCIVGGCAHATGIGTTLKPIKSNLNCYFVLVKPDISVSTKKAYELSDSVKDRKIRKVDAIINAIETGNLNYLGQNLFNRFEEVINEPSVNDIKNKLLKTGAVGVCMSGSGPTVFGVFKNQDTAQTSFKHIKNYYPETFLCNPVNENFCPII